MFPGNGDKDAGSWGQVLSFRGRMEDVATFWSVDARLARVYYKQGVIEKMMGFVVFLFWEVNPGPQTSQASSLPLSDTPNSLSTFYFETGIP